MYTLRIEQIIIIVLIVSIIVIVIKRYGRKYTETSKRINPLRDVFLIRTYVIPMLIVISSMKILLDIINVQRGCKVVEKLIKQTPSSY